jgi:predicted DNA-binding transcriptional regulator AlpA
MTMLTRRQVAEMLSVSVKVVAEMAAARQGPPFCKLGDKRNSPVRYPAAQFHEWVESRMVACKSDA